MANVLAKYDQYSSEDYLCAKLRPIDFPVYVCVFCGKEHDIEELNKEYCEGCGEYLHVVEIS